MGVYSLRGGQQCSRGALFRRSRASVPYLPAGPDSPVSPMKELTNAVRKQQRALEARLEACLEELRRLCLREAVRLLESLPPTNLAFI